MLISQSLFAVAYMEKIGPDRMSGWKYIIAQKMGDSYETPLSWVSPAITSLHVIAGDSPVALHNGPSWVVPPRTTQAVEYRQSPDIGRVGHTFRPTVADMSP